MKIDELRTKYREKIIRLAEDCGVENIRVFGSVARGEANEQSDVDLLVHLRKGTSLLKLAAFDRKLSELIGGKVDVVLDDSIYEDIKPFILKDAVML